MVGMRSFLGCSRYDLELDFRLLPPTKHGFQTPFQLITSLTSTFLVNLLRLGLISFLDPEK